jgi:hypothetical protein
VTEPATLVRSHATAPPGAPAFVMEAARAGNTEIDWAAAEVMG